MAVHPYRKHRICFVTPCKHNLTAKSILALLSIVSEGAVLFSKLITEVHCDQAALRVDVLPNLCVSKEKLEF